MRRLLLAVGIVAVVVAATTLLRGAGFKGRAPAGATGDAPAPGPGLHPGSATGPAGVRHPAMMDDAGRLIAGYQVTAELLRTYAAAVKEIRAAGEADAQLMARLREQGPQGETPAEMGMRLERIGPLKAILDRHQLAGVDVVLMPRALALGRQGYAVEEEGRRAADGDTNESVVALYRADHQAMDALWDTIRMDLRALSGR